MSDASTEAPQQDAFAPWMKVGAAVLAVGLLIFLGWLVQSCREARAVSRKFVSAAREGRVEEARALASPELEQGLFGNGTAARTFALLRTAKNDELGVVQSGFGGTWPLIPFACFDGALGDGKAFWVVARKGADGYRVVELRSDRKPTSCEGGDGGD